MEIQANVAQLVERNLAKVEVAGSSLVIRSFSCPGEVLAIGHENYLLLARMVELY